MSSSDKVESNVKLPDNSAIKIMNPQEPFPEECLSKNEYSCIPAAFAMYINWPLSTIIRLFPHDGSQVVNPKAEGSAKYRGFGMSDLRDALNKVNMYWFASLPPGDFFENDAQVFNVAKHVGTAMLFGVQETGTPHVVIYKNGLIYDTNGGIRNTIDMRVEGILMLVGTMPDEHTILSNYPIPGPIPPGLAPDDFVVHAVSGEDSAGVCAEEAPRS